MEGHVEKPRSEGPLDPDGSPAGPLVPDRTAPDGDPLHPSLRDLLGLGGPQIAWGRVALFFGALLASSAPNLLVTMATLPSFLRGQLWQSWAFALAAAAFLTATAAIGFRRIAVPGAAAVASGLAGGLLAQLVAGLLWGMGDKGPAAPALRLLLACACNALFLHLLTVTLRQVRSTFWALATPKLVTDLAFGLAWACVVRWALQVENAFLVVLPSIILHLLGAALFAAVLRKAALPTRGPVAAAPAGAASPSADTAPSAGG